MDAPFAGTFRGLSGVLPASLKIHKPEMAKPPNIVVFAGDDKDVFESAEATLLGIVPTNRFTVFHISSQSLGTHPWFERNTSCLLIASGAENMDAEMWKKIREYVCQAGNVGFFSALDAESIVQNIVEVDVTKKVDASNNTIRITSTTDLITALEINKARVVFAKKSPECEASVREVLANLGVYHALGKSEGLPDLSRGFMMCEKDLMVLDISGMTYAEPVGRSPQLLFKPSALISLCSLPLPSTELIPVEIRRRSTGVPDFDEHLYFDNLKTAKIGKVLISFPVCESTMNISRSIVAGFGATNGILVVAQKQTKGRGRGGNMWLSPAGCAMFTFNYAFPIDSTLGQNSAFVQHILAVAMIDAVLTKVKTTEFPLRIKWPNDLYFDRKYKMGGILVTASMEKDKLHCVLGAALNVANSQPTVCLNDFITPEMSAKLTVEETLAAIMNKFEKYADLFQKEGKESFLRAYHSFWLHSGEVVDVLERNSKEAKKVKIIGLDRSGYLEVRNEADGHVFSVMDDGNTFDMMKGLIRAKD
ncbi:hypothetical protein QR680_012378 [Steinernema hermaphroditum]|uniref:BPL/LPL catalytic domain-containing protein n=1 Tax=Steinernema hermaphroditum TaxID=289476 RepID=A0AA39M0E6_9BILA|nr:hypothetical protein QR680_012378 [Steinernema hermaphroditum]